jgi:hypothetical protein
VYWVGTADGRVSLYQGMPYSVLGVQLYELAEVGRTAYAGLETHVKARVDQRELLTKEEGQRFIRSLDQAGDSPSAPNPAVPTTGPRPATTSTAEMRFGLTTTTVLRNAP